MDSTEGNTETQENSHLLGAETDNYIWTTEGGLAYLLERLHEIFTGEDDHGVPPLNTEQIQNLERRQIGDQGIIRFPSCPICLEAFSADEEVTLPGCPCSHPCHDTCLSEWFHRRGCCPVCRGRIQDRDGGGNYGQGQQEIQMEQEREETGVENGVQRESGTMDRDNRRYKWNRKERRQEW